MCPNRRRRLPDQHIISKIKKYTLVMSSHHNHKHPLTSSRYLTDGGLETTLIYHYEIDLPHFAAFTLLESSEGRQALERYYVSYLEVAARFNMDFILETPTWRANPDWGFKLGYSAPELDDINRVSVRFLRRLQAASRLGTQRTLISGNVGPRGDGYISDTEMSVDEAMCYHLPQITAFKTERVDLVTALTLNYRNEAVGIIEAARARNVPVVISFTVETDGRLPNGESLQSAIENTDALTGAYASYFMINCAHPDHFESVLEGDTEWRSRIYGIRANASTKSHAELDAAATLDAGDAEDLADGYARLQCLLPELKVAGGCCGTDHTHIETICQRVFAGSHSA
jgi:homocysteine S-methyltransferase